MSRFDVNLWFDNAPPPPPARKVIGGSWTCECGVTKAGPVSGHPLISVTTRCLTCGDEAELCVAETTR